MSTIDDVAQLQQVLVQLDADVHYDANTYQNALTQLKSAQDQITADTVHMQMDDATISMLNAKIAQLEAQLSPPAPLAAFPKLKWADEFNGSAVDTTKWNVRNGWAANNEQSICWARNVSTANGALVIQPKRETTTSGSKTQPYTSGYLDTAGKLAIPKPSYIEFRSKLPLKRYYSRGMWPALWFRLHSGSLEIDLTEAWGTPSDHADAWGHFSTSIWKDTMAGTAASNGYHGWADQSGLDLTVWHTYGMRLDADGSMTAYYDGAPSPWTSWANGVATHFGTVTPAQIPGLAWDQTKDQLEIRLNLQIGGTYYGAPDANTDFSQNMQVDYVRLWTPS